MDLETVYHDEYLERAAICESSGIPGPAAIEIAVSQLSATPEVREIAMGILRSGHHANWRQHKSAIPEMAAVEALPMLANSCDDKGPRKEPMRPIFYRAIDDRLSIMTEHLEGGPTL